MTLPTVAPTIPARNGRTRSVTPLRRVLLAVAADVDHLFELRGLIKQAQDEERRLTQVILAALDARRLGALAGTRAVATLEPRTTLRVSRQVPAEVPR
jgi:hypothetical protein